jgi:DNA repair protein RecN (Recombination protein N)
MLKTLSLQNFVIVNALEIDFQTGLTVLTGETGAGKSILFDALGLLLGDRANSLQIKPGANRADLTAEFQLENNASNAEKLNWLAEAGFDAIDNTLLIRRSLEPSGRSRAWINGQPATLSQLKELGEQLVELHGQHAHQALLRTSAQRELFDRHAGLTNRVDDISHAFKTWQQREGALNEAQTKAERLTEELDQIEWQLQILSDLDLQDGEWEQVNEEHQRLAHGAELLAAVESSLAQLEGDEASGLIGIGQSLQQRLGGLLDKDPRLAELIGLIDAAVINLEEAASECRHYLGKADLDPGRFQELDVRLQSIFEAARRLKERPENLFSLRTRLDERKDALDAASDLDKLKVQAEEAFKRYNTLARELTAQRQKAAAPFAKEVTRWLHELAMTGMRFEIRLEPRQEPASFGMDQLEFLVSQHAKGPLLPLAKVASGGELSRVSLAIAAVAAQATQTSTLLFDEVDVGIGGNTGHVVGRLLQELGMHHQVLAVTHLPQVAARGHQHLRVQKQKQDDGTNASGVVNLDRDQRIEEIARMLGDEGVRQSSVKMAKELLSL